MSNSDSLAWRNGKFLPFRELTLSASDAGFVFGATITDYCRTYKHKLFRWPDHLARFRRDCEACFVPLPYSEEEFSEVAGELVSRNSKSEDVALITFATPGEPDSHTPTVGMHILPLAWERNAQLVQAGATLELVGVTPQCQSQVVPTSAKQRSRMNWWMGSKLSKTPSAIPVLTDEHGFAADTGIASVVLVQDGTVIRSPRGTVLEAISLMVLEEKCQQFGIPFAERPFKLCEARGEVLLVGSGVGITGVKTLIPDEPRELPWPGPVFLKLRDKWFE